MSICAPDPARWRCHWPSTGRLARVIGIDDSDAALDYAHRNAEGTSVELVRADVTTPGLLPELDGRVDLVVANPPYVPDDVVLEPEVAQHDPHHAVFGGPDGMAVIVAVVSLAGRWLRPGGLFAVEHDDTTSSETVELVYGTGLFDDIVARQDLAGRPRFVTARRWGHHRLRGREAVSRAATMQSEAMRWRHHPPAGVGAPPLVGEAAPMTEVFDCADPDQRSRGIASAVGALKGGRLVVMPTDTVYGIGADAFDSAAVAALLSAKGRGRDMPVGVLVGSWHTIEGLVYVMPDGARELIRAFWPGALSLVVEQAPSLQLGSRRCPRHRDAANAVAPGRHRVAA